MQLVKCLLKPISAAMASWEKQHNAKPPMKDFFAFKTFSLVASLTT
jgi:hypothetical protein